MTASNNHGHHHGHVHSHGTANYGRAFAIGIVLNMGFVVIEAAYGIVANSLALLSDAGHNLGDVLSLVLAWGAAVLSRREPTARHTYGLRRSSILASLANSVVLLLAIGAIAWEALHRFANPQPIEGATVIVVAAIGIAINTATALLFMSGRNTDLNIRGAFLHMAADALVSVGVVIAGVAIIFTGWLWLDPAVSLAIVLVIAVSTWSMLRDSLNLALDAVPNHIDHGEVDRYLRDLPGVADVHDLHIWAMSTTETAMTVHLVRPGHSLDDGLLARATTDLHQRFGVAHVTFQVEAGDPEFACVLASDAVV
ncbi:MAG: cation diffusion facilitator family transporter [Alphaproteobacteria bacterium]|nr:cation diffusion facilitator family transporter [Alphaproteobacteria bacterium]